ncbi:phage tail assembly protein [Thiomicrorhabdus sp. Kp2]|uniref:phage tail assembly protein n=1 Tax=Thiomicrorhabdus sp. Kp2 TaxID=1123518 RepID=UPI00041FC491|nr:phage tail assembly protein [Thiomicrorhabdus sp. Kp2]
MSKTITVKLPIAQKIGGNKVEKITLRKPMAGELRGLNMLDLVRMDVTAIGTVLPRISDPLITADDFATLESENLMELSGEIAGFFTGSPSQTK